MLQSKCQENIVSQCAPSIFNLDQKFHGLPCFWSFHTYKRVQNQSRKTSVIRSKRVILKRQVFYTKSCLLMAFSRHVYSGEFWKLDDRCFS